MKNNAISISQPGAPAARPTVLIVDDSRLMRVAIKKILKDEFELIEAVDGEDAWAKLLAEPAVRCIFSDLSMPNLDGYGLLARVRGSEDGQIQALPFIVITGKEGDLGGLLEEVRGHGGTDLVGKPFKSDEIIARTRSLLADAPPVAQPAAVLPQRVQENAPSEADVASRRQAEAIQRLAAEAEARRIAEEQEATRLAAEEARHLVAQEETRRIAAEAETRRLSQEQEVARQAAAEEARRIAAEAEVRRLRDEKEAARQAAEAASVAAEQSKQERMAAEEAARRQSEEEARVCEKLRATARRLAEERERLRREEEEALRITGLQALFVRGALPFMALANRVLRLGKGETLDALRKRLR